jgi:hypothetical protein
VDHWSAENAHRRSSYAGGRNCISDVGARSGGEVGLVAAERRHLHAALFFSSNFRLLTCKQERRRGLRLRERHASWTLTPSAHLPSPRRLVPTIQIGSTWRYLSTLWLRRDDDSWQSFLNHQPCQWPVNTARRSLQSFASCSHKMSSRFLSTAPTKGFNLSELRDTRWCRSEIATRQLINTLYSTSVAKEQPKEGETDHRAIPLKETQVRTTEGIDIHIPA